MTLTEKLARRNLTNKSIITGAPASKQAVSHFLAGRYQKAGRESCRRIRDFLIAQGIWSARRKPHAIEDGKLAPWVERKVEREFELARSLQINESPADEEARRTSSIEVGSEEV